MASAPRQQTRAAHGIWGTSTLPVVLILAAMVIGFAALLPLVQSSGVTSTAGRVRQLEQDREDWQARLHQQEIEVAQLTSLGRVEKEARDRLKMVPPTKVHYITVDAPPPAPNYLPDQLLPESPPPPDPGDSLWQEIVSWLPFP